MKLQNKVLKRRLENLETKIMQQQLLSHGQQLVVNQAKTKIDQLSQLAENPLLKDLIAGKGMFSPVKKIKLKTKSPPKDSNRWESSSLLGLGIIGVQPTQSQVSPKASLPEQFTNKNLQKKRQGSARPALFDSLDPEMVPLEVKNEGFGNYSKPDIFEQLDKQRSRKSPPVMREQVRLINSDSASELQHI